MQPSLLVDCLLRLGVELVITLHHVWPAHQQLAVGRGFDFDVRERASDAADSVPRVQIAGDDRRRLGQPVAFDDWDFGRGQEPVDFARQRRAA